jgi:hypothetical protein
VAEGTKKGIELGYRATLRTLLEQQLAGHAGPGQSDPGGPSGAWQTAATPDTAEGLATQLDILTRTLMNAEISEMANERAR